LGVIDDLKDFVESLLLHFFIMMIIPLVNNFVFRQHKLLKGKAVLTVFLLGALLLTMMFPVTITDSMEFDLKFIPVYVAFFYISPLAGLLAIFEIIVYVSITELMWVPMVMVNYGVVSLIFYLLGKPYKKLSFRKKLLIAVLFYILISSTRFIYMLEMGNAIYAWNLMWFSVISTAALLVTI
jgi:two-component system, sporulation sensor kinase B